MKTLSVIFKISLLVLSLGLFTACESELTTDSSVSAEKSTSTFVQDQNTAGVVEPDRESSEINENGYICGYVLKKTAQDGIVSSDSDQVYFFSDMQLSIGALVLWPQNETVALILNSLPSTPVQACVLSSSAPTQGYEGTYLIVEGLEL